LLNALDAGRLASTIKESRMAINVPGGAPTGGPRLEWDGKRTQVERIQLPFQVIETVNEPREKDLFSAQAAQQALATGWRNKLIWGDNKLVCASLLKDFEGKIDLIYIDPPFDTGDDFSFRVSIGDEPITKLPSIIEVKAYNDMWASVGSYLQMMYDRLVLFRELLTDRGSIFVCIAIGG
jgi:adenine-specific DNA-methyltransferase